MVNIPSQFKNIFKKTKKIVNMNLIANLKKNEIIEHFLVKYRFYASKIRFGDFIFIGGAFAFTFIPIAIMKNLFYKTQTIINPDYGVFWLHDQFRNQRMKTTSYIYEPHESLLLDKLLYSSYKDNLDFILAKDNSFFYIQPKSNQALEYDHTYYCNRMKQLFDDRIKIFLKEGVVKGKVSLFIFFLIKDMIETECTNDISYMGKQIIIDSYLKSDYKNKIDLYNEMIEIESKLGEY